MKLATIAALSVLIVLPAEAGHRHQQIGSPAATCDNDGHCTTLTTKAPAPSFHRSRSKTQTTIATTESTRLVDANGNTAGVIISGKTGARALALLMLRVSNPILMIWKTITARA
jgi:hypothetical protein